MPNQASLAYLLVYAANIDLNFSDEEKTHQLSQFTDPEILEKAIKDFEADDELEKVKKVQSIIATYGNSENSKTELLNAVKGLMSADQDASAIEEALVRVFRMYLK